MEDLIKYVLDHSERGSCTCGRCVDAPAESTQPTGHTANLIFFKVAAKDSPDAARLKELVENNRHGSFNDVDLFDDKEHGYMELGGWIGDQELALTLMGLGTILGLWELLTPETILKMNPEDALAKQMAASGFLTIKHKKELTANAV